MVSSLLFREKKHLGLARLYDILDEGGKPVKSHTASTSILLIICLIIGVVSYGGILTWTIWQTNNPIVSVKNFWIFSKAGIEGHDLIRKDNEVSIIYTSKENEASGFLYQASALVQNVGLEETELFSVKGANHSGNLSFEVNSYPTDDMSRGFLLEAISYASAISSNGSGYISLTADWVDNHPTFVFERTLTWIEQPKFSTYVDHAVSTFRNANVDDPNGPTYTLRIGIRDSNESPIYFEQSFSNYQEAYRIFSNVIPTTWDSLILFYNDRRAGQDAVATFIAKEYPGDSTLTVLLPESRLDENAGEEILTCGVYYAPPGAFCFPKTQ